MGWCPVVLLPIPEHGKAEWRPLLLWAHLVLAGVVHSHDLPPHLPAAAQPQGTSSQSRSPPPPAMVRMNYQHFMLEKKNDRLFQVTVQIYCGAGMKNIKSNNKLLVSDYLLH